MTIYLYIETNFIMGIAKGQDVLAENFLKNLPKNVKIFMPSVCYFEALVALETERKRLNKFNISAKVEINEADRNQKANVAQNVVSFLRSSLFFMNN